MLFRLDGRDRLLRGQVRRRNIRQGSLAPDGTAQRLRNYRVTRFGPRVILGRYHPFPLRYFFVQSDFVCYRICRSGLPKVVPFTASFPGLTGLRISDGATMTKAVGNSGEVVMNAAPLDLSFLYGRRIFRSQRSVDSHIHTARELADHSLRWRKGAIDTVLCKASMRKIEIFALRYGAEVEIMPQPVKGFFLIHVSLKGATEVTVDGEQILLSEGMTGWMAPRRTWRMRWQAGTEQMIIKIPTDLLATHDQDAEGGGQAVNVRPLGTLKKSLEPQWRSLLQTCMYASSTVEGGFARDEWLYRLEETVGAFLAMHGLVDPLVRGCDTAFQRAPTRADGLICAARIRNCLEALEDFIGQRLSAPLSIEDLAQAAGVSPRTLQSICVRQLGITPMEMLRAARLDAVHSRLLAEVETNVTDVALRFGFGHLGRFSAYYRMRFGELPSVTVKLGSRRADARRSGRPLR